MSYCPWGREVLDMTDQLPFSLSHPKGLIYTVIFTLFP